MNYIRIRFNTLNVDGITVPEEEKKEEKKAATRRNSVILDKMNADKFNGFPGFELPDLKPKFSILILTEPGWNISCLNNNKE